MQTLFKLYTYVLQRIRFAYLLKNTNSFTGAQNFRFSQPKGQSVNQICKYIRLRPPGDLESRTTTYITHALLNNEFWIRDGTTVPIVPIV